MSLNVKSQRTKNRVFFPPGGTDDSTNLICETLHNVHCECVNIHSFTVLDIKLCLEEDGDLHTDHPLYSFKFKC